MSQRKLYAPLTSSHRPQNYYGAIIEVNSRKKDSIPITNDPVDSSLQVKNITPLKLLLSQLRQILPFLWPKQNPILQLNIFLIGLLLLAGRVANLFIPIYNKKIVDSLTGQVIEDDWHDAPSDEATPQFIPPEFRWDLVVIWVVLKGLQGGMAGTTGLIGNISSFIFLFNQQYTIREVEVKFFRHLNDLSLRWHYGKKIGMVTRALDRGTMGINLILQYFLFNLLPAILDIIIAICYFAAVFNYIFALILGLTMVAYFVLTFILSNFRTKFKRRMNGFDNIKRQLGLDALMSIEAVKNYGAEEYESGRYASVMAKFQREEVKFTFSESLVDLVQSTVITIGFLAGSLLCVKMVITGADGLTVGSYILFTTYMVQLFEPLSNFAVFYKILLRRVVEMENMFELFKVESEVKDMPGATELFVKNAQIEFKDVSFGYSKEREVLTNISFTVPPGNTVAIVGESGGGKTSIVRLISRYFDVLSGCILIDGQNIQFVQKKSLRKHIGIVPQETILFNDTIENNIRYGRLDASTAEVIEAAKIACIHPRIVTFPEGYKSVVGERGMKLSGGERQRIAIARTVLKNPPIVLLDEATSALDTHTEKEIQESLYKLCEGRTCVVVAHRLSTIISANRIIVLNKGEIAESGTHMELLALDGLYANMWRVQQRALSEQDEDEAQSPTSDDESHEAGGRFYHATI